MIHSSKSLTRSTKLLFLSLNLSIKQPQLNYLNTIRMSSTTSSWSPKINPYPIVRRDENYTESFKSLAKNNEEVIVKDPYHYLTVPSTSEETKKFVEDQSEYTKNYLLANKINAEKYKKVLTENWDYSKCK